MVVVEEEEEEEEQWQGSETFHRISRSIMQEQEQEPLQLALVVLVVLVVVAAAAADGWILGAIPLALLWAFTHRM